MASAFTTTDFGERRSFDTIWSASPQARGLRIGTTNQLHELIEEMDPGSALCYRLTGTTRPTGKGNE